MMWESIEQMLVKEFIASDLYTTVKLAIVKAGEGSQHAILDEIGDEHIDSILL